MSPIYLYNGKLLIRDNKLTADPNCCCSSGCPVSTCISISCYDSERYTEIDCKRDGIHIHTINIPEEYTLPVKVNIAGFVDDDLLINGQSASDLGYDPGPYIGNGECIVAHTIGEIPLQNDPSFPQGNQDPNKYPSITFPHNNQSFTVAARDTELSNHILNITICLDPYNEQNVCLPPTVSGCCGAQVYCFEKTIERESPLEDCKTYSCAAESPGEEWTQISGPFDCSVCSDCPPAGVCVGYTEWKIIDQDNYVYGTGIIVYQIDGGGYLNDLPNAFTPIHYGTAGSKNFDLQAKCGGTTWHTIYEWDGDIVLCSGSNERYPSHYFNGNWSPKGACAEKINQNGDVICDTNGTSETCPLLNPGTLGNGIDPDRGVAYKFTGSADTEYTNLANWEDASGLSPAASLPGNNDDILVIGSINKIPNDYGPVVLGNVTVSGAGFNISFSCQNLTCTSATLGYSDNDGGYCDIQTRNIVVGGSCNITGTTIYNADLTCDTIILDGGSEIYDFSTVYGNAELNNGSFNNGNIDGNAIFKTGSWNTSQGEVINGSSTFYDNSYNVGTIWGEATFYNTSTNGGALEGLAKFYGSSKNVDSISTLSNTLTGGAKFYDTSENTATVSYCVSSIEFRGSSKNKGFIPSCGSIVYFYDTSENTSSGSTDGDAEFNGSAKNSGSVGGTATFNGSSCNNGGTAGTFVPDPPPSC